MVTICRDTRVCKVAGHGPGEREGTCTLQQLQWSAAAPMDSTLNKLIRAGIVVDCP